MLFQRRTSNFTVLYKPQPLLRVPSINIRPSLKEKWLMFSSTTTTRNGFDFRVPLDFCITLICVS